MLTVLPYYFKKAFIIYCVSGMLYIYNYFALYIDNSVNNMIFVES